MLVAAVSLAVTTAGYYLSLQPRAERGRSHLNEIYQLHYSCKTVFHVSLLALILVTKMESVYCCKYHRADEIGRVRMKSSKRNYGCGAGRFHRSPTQFTCSFYLPLHQSCQLNNSKVSKFSK